MSKNNYSNNINAGKNNTFNGSMQIAGQIINNSIPQDNSVERATYTPEPLWRSPFTLGLLTWISVIIGVIGILPIGKIASSVFTIFDGSLEMKSTEKILIWIGLFLVAEMLFIVCFSLRKIAKKQTRHPLFCNLAISGYGNILVIERIHSSKCPRCGGEMRYYNKPIEWVNTRYSDGKVKREVTKRIPVLECKRNADHCYKVDSAEDKVD